MAIAIIVVWTLIAALPSSLALLFASRVVSRRAARRRAVGFFHPYTNDGGGGERVLWCAVRAVQEERPDLDCAVYTGDQDASPDSLTARAIDRFGVKLLRPPEVQNLFSFSLLNLLSELLLFLFWSTFVARQSKF